MKFAVPRLLASVLLAGAALVVATGPAPALAANSITVETRISGANRYETANALALAAAQARGSGNTSHIVVASGVKFPDGLSAAALAGAADAVVLLTPPDSLPDSVATAIGGIRSSDGLTNTITTATIVGGESAVSATVKTQLESLGLTVARIQGDNRYQTANNVAREVHRRGGIGDFDGLKTVFLATGENFPDSLAASSWSYRNVNPVLLATGSTLDPTTRDTLQQLGVQQVLVLGGTTAISSGIESALATVPGVTTVRRLQGANRYETATAIATALAEHDSDYSTRALFVSGSSFPDALAAAPFAGQADSYAVIPVGSTLPTAVATWIAGNVATLTTIRPIGGTTAVRESVLDAALGRPADSRPGTGFTSVFMGHSFFQPPAQRLDGYARGAGFSDHTQTIVFGGGSSGAPEAMWNDAARRNEIQALLATGQVDLLGMTYHPEYPTLDGYRLWVDEALKYNPNTAFFMGMPWLLDPATRTPAEYAATWQNSYDTIATPIVQQLAVEYPTTSFFAIPYGRAAADLYVLLDSGFLPGVTSLVGDGRSSLFRDDMGHGGQVLDELAGLVWLRSIYCVDLSSFTYPSMYSLDLQALAMAIVADQKRADTAPWCRFS